MKGDRFDIVYLDLNFLLDCSLTFKPAPIDEDLAFKALHCNACIFMETSDCHYFSADHRRVYDDIAITPAAQSVVMFIAAECDGRSGYLQRGGSLAGLIFGVLGVWHYLYLFVVVAEVSELARLH